MSIDLPRTGCMVGLVCCIFIVICAFDCPAAAPIPVKAVQEAGQTDSAADRGISVEALSDAEADALLGRLLERKIKLAGGEAAGARAAAPIDALSEADAQRQNQRLLVRIFVRMERFFGYLDQAFSRMFRRSDSSGSVLRKAIAGFTEDRGASYLAGLFLWLIGIIGCGAGIELLLRRKSADFHDKIATWPDTGRARKAWRILLHLILDMGFVAVYMIVTFLLLVLFFEQKTGSYLFVGASLIASYCIRLAVLILDALLAPQHDGLRVLPFGDQDARYLFRWLSAISAVGIILGVAGIAILLLETGTQLHRFCYSLSGLSVTLLIIFMIFSRRKTVSQVIRSKLLTNPDGITPLQEKMA
jgi:hypothetical protein